MMDDYAGKSRGFGFVEMANAEDGEKENHHCPQRHSATNVH
jgi:hypothetical protein